MRLVKPGFEVWAASGHHDLPYDYDRPLELIEAAARTCYKSEDKVWTICPKCEWNGRLPHPDGEAACKVCAGGYFRTSAEKMVNMLIRRGHHAMLEHSWAVARAIHNNKVDFCTPFVRQFELRDVDGLPDGTAYCGNHRALNEYYYRIYGTSWVKKETWRDKQIRLPIELALAHPYAFAMTVKIVCDRGVTHEIVRHRPASYAQESTRYCNYKGGVTFIIPPWVDLEPGDYNVEHFSAAVSTSPQGEWMMSCWNTEVTYKYLLDGGWTPQQARSVLPNSLKTEIVITASLAEWQHIFKLRCAEAAHPQMREVMIPLREKARQLYPGVFDG